MPQPSNSIDQIIEKLNSKIPQLKGVNRILTHDARGEEMKVFDTFMLGDGQEYIARRETIEQTKETEVSVALDEEGMQQIGRAQV